MTIKAIIFDMDGTIVDTEHIWTLATKNLLSSRAISQCTIESSDVFNKIHGLAVDKSCKILKDTFSLIDPLELLIKEKSSFAISLYEREVRFIEGFIDFHKKITKAHLKTGLATNADDQTLEVTNKALNLTAYFGEHMYNVSCVDNRCKPDPALYLHTAQQLDLDPTECIAIEDSAHGIIAAKKAGMRCIGINTIRNKKILAHADLIIDGYEELDFNTLLQF